MSFLRVETKKKIISSPSNLASNNKTFNSLYLCLFACVGEGHSQETQSTKALLCLGVQLFGAQETLEQLGPKTAPADAYQEVCLLRVRSVTFQEGISPVVWGF